MKDKIAKGANFCHVDKIKQLIQDSDDITEVYQKCRGAPPSFSRSAN